MAFEEKNRMQPLTHDMPFTWDPSISFSPSSFSGFLSQVRLCEEITTASWEYAFKAFGTNSLPATTTATGRRAFKCKKVYLSLSFVTVEIQEQWTPSWKPNFEFFHFCLQGPHFSKLPQNSATTWIMWTALLCLYLPNSFRADPVTFL